MNRLPLDEKSLSAQRAAQKMIRRDTILVLGLAMLILAAIYVIGIWLQARSALLLIMVAYVVVYIIFRGVYNWRQWAALVQYDLHCPYCKKPLAEKINYLWAKLRRGPTSNCPHCGMRALATLNQLEEK